MHILLGNRVWIFRVSFGYSLFKFWLVETVETPIAADWTFTFALKTLYHRIGWWKKIQENPIFDGKNHGLRLRFSVKPIRWPWGYAFLFAELRCRCRLSLSGIVPGQADLVDEAGSEHRTGARFKSQRIFVDPQSTCGISSFKQGIYLLGLYMYFIYIYMCVFFPFRKCVFMGCKWMQRCIN